MILSIIVASLHCQDRRKIWKSRGINDYAVGIIYPTALIEIGLNNVSAKIWKGNCPRYLPFPTALQVGPFMYSIFPHIFYGFKSVYYFQTFLLFHGDFFQFQFGFRTRRTDHGLRMPNEAFFHQNPKLLGLDRQFGQINFGTFGVLSADLSAPILVLWVPCPCFPLINH